MSLSKPSRTIVVEPVQAPQAVPAPPPDPAPREERPAEVPARP